MSDTGSSEPLVTDYENKAYLDQNLIKLLSITIDSIETIFEWNGLLVGHFQNCVQHPCPPSKIAVITWNIFFSEIANICKF